MRSNNDLESQLAQWAKEYGGGRYDNHGWAGISPLAVLIKYQGRPPQGLNPNRVEVNGAADEVEKGVRMFECQTRGRIQAAVLRCECFAGPCSRAEKTQRLARMGHGRMSETRYSHHLRAAKQAVAMWLRIPFDEPLEDAAAAEMLSYVLEME